MSSDNFLLNHDCWWKILQHLQLRDQIKLRQSGAPIGPIIDEFWQRKFSTLEVRGGILPNCQEWKVLVGGVCATVEVLKMCGLSREHFDVLLLHTFPRAVDFRFSPMQFDTITDEDVVPLSKAFPNLRTLVLDSRLTGRDVWTFRHLTHLTLTHPIPCVQMENIVRFLQEVPVKSIHYEKSIDLSLDGSDFLVLFRLEEFSTGHFEWYKLAYYWNHLLNDSQRQDSGPLEAATDKQAKPDTVCSAMQEREEFRADQFFANLKCLTVTEWRLFPDYVFPDFKHRRIIAVDMGCLEPMYMSEFYVVWQEKHLGQLEHLRQVALYGITIPGCARQLGHLQNLQEICLYYCYIHHEQCIWNLLRNSTRLERLSVENCAMGFPVFHVSDDNLATARSSPLTLNFFGNIMKESRMPVTVVSDCTSSRCEVTSIETAKRDRLTWSKTWLCFYFE